VDDAADPIGPRHTETVQIDDAFPATPAGVRLVTRRGHRAYVTYEAYPGRVSENARELPITDARDRLADVVNEAAYTGQVTYLTRRGRRLAAIVSVEAAEAAERWEDEQLGRMADDALAEMTRTGETPVALDEVRRELGL
jgi:antitoxin Phd